jgi:hypothetical protein
MTEVFAVHAVRPDEIRPTQMICQKLSAAEKYAAGLSTEPDVLAAGVTRFILDELGTRTPIALYVRGIRQKVPYVSDDRKIHAGGAAKLLGARWHA